MRLCPLRRPVADQGLKEASQEGEHPDKNPYQLCSKYRIDGQSSSLSTGRDLCEREEGQSQIL
jgi:hypothetical protein